MQLLLLPLLPALTAPKLKRKVAAFWANNVKSLKINRTFPHPTVIWCPRSRWYCHNFHMNHTSLKTRMMGLSDDEDRMILAGSVKSQYQHVTDGQTERRLMTKAFAKLQCSKKVNDSMGSSSASARSKQQLHVTKTQHIWGLESTH